MKNIKIYVLLLAMIATGTTGFMSCSKKDTAPAQVQKEYGVSLTQSEKQWLSDAEKQAQQAVAENPDAKTAISVANPANPYDYTGTNYAGVLNTVKNHIASDVVYVNDSTLNACVTENNIYNRIQVCTVLAPDAPPCPVSNFRFGAQTIFHLYSDYFSETDSILGVLLAQNKITNLEYATVVLHYDLTRNLNRNAYIAVTKVFENLILSSTLMSSSQKLRLLSAFAIGRYAKDYWVSQTNTPSSAFKPLFDRFTQDPKLFVYEFVDMSVIGFLIGYTQDNQITKGTRTAALYAYSDVIYVLKPKNKWSCVYHEYFGYSICDPPVGASCRNLGVRCMSDALTVPTLNLSCN
ncbi:MAG: hypothetical protein NZ455_04310 [Bacteroidia bacterium]|nr:hypothetical protein [Bacteroidia bacterium]